MNGTARGGELEVRAGSLVNESVTFTLVIQAVRPAVGEGSTGIASAPNFLYSPPFPCLTQWSLPDSGRAGSGGRDFVYTQIVVRARE